LVWGGWEVMVGEVVRNLEEGVRNLKVVVRNLEG
jgi:hypothetical protein